MFQVLVLEDMILKASYDANEKNWQVICTDSMSGKRVQDRLTNIEMAAISALAHGLGEEEDVDVSVTRLYEIAEAAIKDWPIEVRPIP